MTNDEERETQMTKLEERMANEFGNVSDHDPDTVFWLGNDLRLVRDEPRDERVYDLEERTARFGEMVIDFAKTLPQNAITSRIISQLIGAATSVGANYLEADDGVSKRDFLKSIGTCRKEARETKHFLRMAVRAVPEVKQGARKIWSEARELHLIFSKIWRSGRQSDATRSSLP